MYFRVDRIPFEGFVGWDAASNGNLAQVLQEPSLMGAYEGAGITVLGRGVNQNGVPRGSSDLWGVSHRRRGAFADGSVYLNGTTRLPLGNEGAVVNDYGTANFLCNPSSIDGFSIINSSQGGGGIFMHGWNHNLQVANNRISANAGTLSGGDQSRQRRNAAVISGRQHHLRQHRSQSGAAVSAEHAQRHAAERAGDGAERGRFRSSSIPTCTSTTTRSSTTRRSAMRCSPARRQVRAA